MAEPTVKRWLAVHNIQLPAAGKVWGRAFRFGERRFRWTPSDGDEFPKESLVQSGSQFEVALTAAKETDWLKRKAIAPLDANVHFNLEDVFGEDGAKALRLSNIWTLEEVVSGKMGNVLVGDKFIKIHSSKMVSQLVGGKPDVIAALMDDARKLVERGAKSEKAKPKPLTQPLPPQQEEN